VEADMNRFAGILTALALAGSPAFAQQQPPTQPGQQQPLSSTVRGQVLQLEGQTLYIQQGGAAVPLQISGVTRFAPGFDLDAVQPGTQIVARIRVENGRDNIVQEIGLPQRRGVGGAGQAGETPAAEEEGTLVIEPLNPAAEQILQGEVEQGEDENAPGPDQPR
jgi:hypothetical protein